MLLTVNSSNPLIDLHDGLKAFGLNPMDWMVLKEKEQVYKVKSKCDQNFIFQGKAKKKGPSLKWERLELISI